MIQSKEIKENLNSDVKTSISSDTTRMVINKLHDFELEFYVATPTEIDVLLNSERAVCSAARIKTDERAKNTLYSLPVNIYPNLRLYYPRKLHPLVNEVKNDKGLLKSLPELFLHYPDQVLTIIKNRSYGAFLDREISKLKSQYIYEIEGRKKHTYLPKMLQRGRTAFTLIFPTTYKKSITQTVAVDANNSIGISGTKPFILGHIACSRTQLGNKVIAQVNQIIKSLYLTDKFYLAHQNYISKVDSESFKQQFTNVFLKNITNSDN
jgi:uncharacterized protein (TIGR02285 family)